MLQARSRRPDPAMQAGRLLLALGRRDECIELLLPLLEDARAPARPVRSLLHRALAGEERGPRAARAFEAEMRALESRALDPEILASAGRLSLAFEKSLPPSSYSPPRRGLARAPMPCCNCGARCSPPDGTARDSTPGSARSGRHLERPGQRVRAEIRRCQGGDRLRGRPWRRPGGALLAGRRAPVVRLVEEAASVLPRPSGAVTAPCSRARPPSHRVRAPFSLAAARRVRQARPHRGHRRPRQRPGGREQDVRGSPQVGSGAGNRVRDLLLLGEIVDPLAPSDSPCSPTSPASTSTWSSAGGGQAARAVLMTSACASARRSRRTSAPGCTATS